MRYNKVDDVAPGPVFEEPFEEAPDWARSEPLIFRRFGNHIARRVVLPTLALASAFAWLG